MTYVTGAAILAQAGVAAPSTEQSDWADLCAAAIEAVIAERMADVTITAGITAQLERAALLDGIAAYTERTAPHGILSVGPDGDVARLGRGMVRALEPVFLAKAGPGIG